MGVLGFYPRPSLAPAAGAPVGGRCLRYNIAFTMRIAGRPANAGAVPALATPYDAARSLTNRLWVPETLPATMCAVSVRALSLSGYVGVVCPVCGERRHQLYDILEFDAVRRFLDRGG